MYDPIAANRLNWDERAAIHARDTTGDYMLDRFRAGEDALHDIDAAEVGDISGKHVLHLQCHIGRDTLCLARRGAIVTGLDFSAAALAVARQLAAETKLSAHFIEGEVEAAPRLTPGPFDLPNPTTQKTTVSFTQVTPQYLTVQNAVGQVLESRQLVGNAPVELDFSAYAAGVLFVKVQGLEGIAVKRVVKN